MRELFLQPEVQSYATFREFRDAFQLGAGDLLITNEPILPGFKNEIPENVHVICTETYGIGEPSDVMFDAIQADLADVEYSRVIAVGGGSAIDTAKALCAAEGRMMDELFDTPPAELRRTRTLICLPTTCGTGSEVTVTAVFDRTRKGTKMGITSYALGTDYAVLVPALLESLPFSVFASSSIDALIHAVESYLNCQQATVASRMFAERAIRMILPIYRDIEKDGPESRNRYLLDMQLASNFGGIAIANALPSAAHAMGYPFAGKFHRPHGEACYVFLNATMEKYLRDVQGGMVEESKLGVWNSLMAILASALSMEGSGDEAVIKELDRLLGCMLTRKSLKEYGATPQDCVDFGKSCYAEQQRLMTCAFTAFTEEELIGAYQSVYE